MQKIKFDPHFQRKGYMYTPWFTLRYVFIQEDMCCSLLTTRINGFLDTALPCFILFLQTEDIKWCQKSSTCRMEPAASFGLPIYGQFVR